MTWTLVRSQQASHSGRRVSNFHRSDKTKTVENKLTTIFRRSKKFPEVKNIKLTNNHNAKLQSLKVSLLHSLEMRLN